MTSLRSVFVKRVAIPVLGRAYNADFYKYYSHWRKTQYWRTEELEAYRWQQFRALLEHTAATVPFYRDYFRQTRLTLADFSGFSDLAKLPVVDKETYQRHGLDQFVSEGVALSHRVRESTSGTSGRPFAFFIDARVVASKMARLLRENSWAGWEPGEPYVRLWGEHRETKVKRAFYDVVMGRLELPAFSVDQEFDTIVRTISRRRPRVMEAYTSAAVHLARMCRERGLRPPPIPSIIVSAETLTPIHRQLIEEQLGGQVYNRYGSREFGNIAHECAARGFHVNAESFFVEEDSHASIDGAANLVISFFDNYSMPFIRYRIGDIGALSQEKCACGLTLPLLKNVGGRSTDFFVLDGGRLLPFLYFNYFFEQYGGIVDMYQVAQPGTDELLVRVVPSTGFGAGTEQEIRSRLLAHVGGQTAVSVEVCEQLPREQSGKLRVYKPLTPSGR